jgi:hypothetical protein
MSSSQQEKSPPATTCPACDGRVPLADGIEPSDALWLHRRRCTEEALFPDLSVVCPACEDAIAVSGGLSATEALWMHGHDCPNAPDAEFANAS